MKNITIFCLPFAGGNKYSYKKFEEISPSFINFSTLEYPGRGSRSCESLLTNIDLLVDDLYEQIKYSVFGPYAIYGHSMGGLLTYLLALKLLENGHELPLHLFITGTPGPAGRHREMKRHLLDKEDFLIEIKKLNGLPEEVLNNSELWEYYEPILRADFMASENYTHRAPSPLTIPITVLTGTEEELEQDKILMWQNESLYDVDFKRLPGNHFFIYPHASKIVQTIVRKLYQ